MGLKFFLVEFCKIASFGGVLGPTDYDKPKKNRKNPRLEFAAKSIFLKKKILKKLRFSIFGQSTIEISGRCLPRTIDLYY